MADKMTGYLSGDSRMRLLLTLLALGLFLPDASAAFRRRRAEPVYQQPTYSPVSTGTAATRQATDALEELNRLRAQRGLYPLLRDDGLTQGALACATYRAQHGIRGHTNSDFVFLPSGSSASVGGCSAVEAEWGFLACEQYTRQYRYAGAASVVGANGVIFHHLFLR